MLHQFTALQLPSVGPIAPPPGPGGLVIAALQCFAVAGSFAQESQNPTEYSKFASGKQLDNPIPSKSGMFRIYVPSAIAAAGITAWQQLGSNDSANFSWVTPLLFVHFLKRCLEVAFVHNYSGYMPAGNANGIGTYYTLITLLVAFTATPATEIASPSLLQAGLALYVVGEIGNLYHHYLLKRLRQQKDETDRRYLPPAGGLFTLVAAPHYLFELAAWLGMACVAQQTHAFLTFASMCSYLAARAQRTNRLYQETFSKEEWPRSKKALIPGVF